MTHKLCPICKEEKPVSEYYQYYSSSRKKYRYSNYCKPCGKRESKGRALKHYADNREEKKEYARQYRANPDNKEKLAEVRKEFKNKYREQLQDCYVREQLAIPNPPKELIEAKRLELKIKRKLKSIQNGKK